MQAAIGIPGFVYAQPPRAKALPNGARRRSFETEQGAGHWGVRLTERECCGHVISTHATLCP